MRKIILLFSALICLSHQEVAAQSFTDLLKGLMGSSTQTAPASKPVFPSDSELIGRWVYKSLDMEYLGSDALASMAVTAAKSQLSSLATKFDIASGRDYIDIERRKATVVSGERKGEARYTYIPSTGQMIITAEHNKQKYTITAWVTVREDGIAVMFKAVELVAIASTTKQYQENTTLQALGSLVNNYPEIRIGAILARL